MKKNTTKKKRRWVKPKISKKEINIFSGSCAGGMTTPDSCDDPIQLS